MSIAAQIATFPLGFYCFQQFPNFFLLANLVVIPLSFVILILGISYLVLVSVPIINEIVLFFLDWSFTILNAGVKWVEQLPYSVFWGISIQWYDVILLYSFILAITFSLINRSKKILVLGLAFLTLTLVTNWYAKFSVLNQNKIVFYSIKNQPAIDIYFGQESYFIALPSLISDSNKLRYHIYPNRYYNIGHGGTDFTIPITNSNHLFEIRTKKILLLNQEIFDSNYQEQFPVIDLIYLSDIAFLDQQIVELLLAEKTKIILGYNVSYKLKAYLKKCFASSEIYDLKEFGAMQITF